MLWLFVGENEIRDEMKVFTLLELCKQLCHRRLDNDKW